MKLVMPLIIGGIALIPMSTRLLINFSITSLFAIRNLPISWNILFRLPTDSITFGFWVIVAPIVSVRSPNVLLNCFVDPENVLI